jgi:hypothetical protein
METNTMVLVIYIFTLAIVMALIIAVQQYELKKLRTEKAMMISQLNGKCWCCSKAHKILNREAYSCDHLKERGVIARGGNGKCGAWEWRGEQKPEPTQK